MGLFDGISNATIGKGGYYFLDGLYIVDVVRAFAQVSRKREPMYIVEASIAWSSNQERPVGSVPSWCVMMRWDAALGHVKGFLAACEGADPTDDAAVRAVFTDEHGNDITEACAEFSVDPSNPMAGCRLELEVVTTKTKSGGEYSLHKWKPYNAEQFQARVAAMQAA